jgi:hypothetical protein
LGKAAKAAGFVAPESIYSAIVAHVEMYEYALGPYRILVEVSR